MSKIMKQRPELLSVGAIGRPVGVDRGGDGAILGYVVAQAGPFKSAGRGEFDLQSLESIVQLGNAQREGLIVRFQHPGFLSDGLDSILGRSMDFSLTTTTNAEGKTVPAVRADLYFYSTAHETPRGNLAKYVMDLATIDAGAISSSLVLSTEIQPRLDAKGRPLTSPDGEPLPPLWRPTALHASDIVGIGDAVDALLSAEQPQPATTEAVPVVQYDRRDLDTLRRQLALKMKRCLI